MKFLHTADWQIGKPYARVSDVNKRSILQNQRFAAIERIAEVAQSQSVHFVLVAGDLFDSNTVDNATVSKACSAIGKIDSPVFAIPGNHDHGGAGSIWNQEFFRREQQDLAPNLRILTESEAVETDTAVILPCPLLQRAESVDTTAWLRDQNVFSQLPSGKPRIILAHGSVQAFTSEASGEDSESEASNFLNLDRLPDTEIDYIALGDWHGAKQVGEKAWYSGTPEFDRFQKGAENRPGNVLLVDVSRSSPPKVETIQTGHLKWHRLAYSFADDASLDDFQNRLDKLLLNRVSEDLLRLDLSGALGIAAATKLEEMIESLQSRLLRLKLAKDVLIVPSDAEIEELTQRQTDPVISTVAQKLVDQSRANDESGDIARLALRELYATCHRLI